MSSPSTIPPPASGRWIGIACGVVAALLFAGKGPLIRTAYANGAAATGLLGWRMLLSVPCFAAVALWYAHRDGPLQRRDRLRLLALGVLGYHVASWLDLQGLEYIDAALERVVLYVYPTLVLGVAILRRQQRCTVPLMLALAATYGGVLLTWGDRIRIGDPQRTAIGVAWVVASAVAFAGYLVFSEEILRRVGGIRSMAVAMLGASTTGLVHAALAAPAANWTPSPLILGIAGVLAIGATLIPVLLSGVAVQRLGAARMAVLGTVAPAATAVIAWLTLGETLGALGWLGVGVTTVGAVMIGRGR